MEKLFLLVVSTTLLQVKSEKRIVLHSATDMAQELLKLQSEFESFKVNTSKQISTMADKITTLESENAKLKIKKGK